jgi:DHA1 family tetracycline resistance protein-like MFS transporter
MGGISTPLKNHVLITFLKNLHGNPRGCVYPEPLWGIPYNLYAPYISVYMIALGLSDQQIGLILSISWGVQIFQALLSGMVTDKLGRRRTSLIFEILAWSVPALISAVAQNFWYFLAASLVNTFWRITSNSWTCLLVEDADPDQLVDIYTWINIATQLFGFIAPLAGVLIATFNLIPAMRGLYFFAALMFTLKAFVTYWLTQETRQGLVRLHETRHQSILSVLGEYKGVFRTLLRTPQTLYTAAILLVAQITLMINSSFWAILVTGKLHIPAQNLAIFPFVKSAIMLVFFFTVMPLVNRMHFKRPLTLGFLGFVASQLLLVTAPSQGYLYLIPSVFLEACSFAMIGPLIDKLTVLTIDAKERARIQSIVYVGIILLTSPFGWIAGTLSEINKSLPFILNIVLYTLGAGLAYRIGTAFAKRLAPVSLT